jgi:membrane-associated phospholipid phosphatase
MNLTDRIYLAVHIALTLLVVGRYPHIPHWPGYVVWNIAAVLAIRFLARMSPSLRVPRPRLPWAWVESEAPARNSAWEFAHDWLPGAIFFTSVFEQISFLSLALVPQWQSAHLAAFELAVFAMPPAAWLHAHAPGWLSEFFAFGYLCFYPMYPIIGVTLWFWRTRPNYQSAFRRMTDALSSGYMVCYATYLLWPTQSPNHTYKLAAPASTGWFHALIRFVQGTAGVHGNAFPSAHIMLAFVVLIFVWRYFPQIAPWLLLISILMCLGAVYDGYHWASDTIVGAIIGCISGLLFLRGLPKQPLPS